jgi:hypothetical protein
VILHRVTSADWDYPKSVAQSLAWPDEHLQIR